MLTPPSPPLSNTITFSDKIIIPEMISNNAATTSGKKKITSQNDLNTLLTRGIKKCPNFK